MSRPKAAQKAPKRRAGAVPDVNENAFRMMLEATGQAPKTAPPEKNSAAVALGKLGPRDLLLKWAFSESHGGNGSS